MRLLIMGAPGSGKGTQAASIADHYGVPAISTGDIFRANVSDGTALGRVVRGYMDAGEYVPDEVTNALVRDRLTYSDCAPGFLLDGYPRTLQQVAVLEEILEQTSDALDAVVELVVDHEVLVDRLVRRSRSQGRSDDTAEVVRRRQAVYLEQTAPLINHFSARGLIRRVDADGSVGQVAARIASALNGLPAKASSSL